MHPSLTRLLSIASEPIAEPSGATDALNQWGTIGRELAEMLAQKNGFYACESALLVRPFEHERAPVGVLEWNATTLWRAEYVEDLSEALFFAEDIFGGQFCIRHDKICTFEPETGLFEPMSSSLDEWAQDIMADYRVRTGFPLAHDWQIRNAPLLPGTRLLPKRLFVLGGKYEVENLYSLADVEGMSFRASIANQIRDVPDGAQVILNSEDPRDSE